MIETMHPSPTALCDLPAGIPAAPVYRPHLGVGRSLLWRRLSFVAPVTTLPLLGLWLAMRLTAGVDDWLRWPLLALVLANLVHLAAIGWPGVLGCLLRLFRPSRKLEARPNGVSRTAVLFPIYNEDPGAVFTAADVMARAMASFGLDRIEIFVLSDTQDPALAALEAATYAGLPCRPGPTIHYRRRAANVRRKAGNIADFCQTWGSAYDYMVVLDADSLMSAEAVATMIGLMDANPRAGIIQTVPYPVGRETLFARAQQFAARLYAPLLVEGLAFWQQADSNYWGHNAIVRIAPFMAHCELPVLPGAPPFGGEILCHDVVEAALMRRGGWEVWMLPGIDGSYEAMPANLVDYAQRERRWCQGNLQHLGVVAAPGLRPLGRYHLGLGVLNYLSGPLAMAFAGLAVLDGLLGGGTTGALLAAGSWEHKALLALLLGVLYGAKLCAVVSVLADGEVAAGFGGRWRLLASALLEQAAVMVSSPVLMVFYTRFIVMMLLGRAVGWDAQPRDDRGLSWSEAWRCMQFPVLVAAVWLAGVLPLDAASAAWSATLLVGLFLAAPFSVLSSRTTLGNLARRLGLLLTPEETAPEAILRAYHRARTMPQAAIPVSSQHTSAAPSRTATLQPAILALRAVSEGAENG